MTAVLRTPPLAAQTLGVFATATIGLAGILALNATRADDHYLDVLNGSLALLSAGLIIHLFYRGIGRPSALAAWLTVFVALNFLAITEWSRSETEPLERAFHIEDFDDILLLVVLPIGLYLGVRTEKVGRSALLFLFAGFASHALSTALDLLDEWFSISEGFNVETIRSAVDFSECVFLELYLIGLGLLITAKPATDAPQQYGRRSVALSWRTALLTELRFRSWRRANPRGSFGDFYAHRVSRRLDRGDGHATLGGSIGSRSRRHREVGQELTVWERGSGTFEFIQSLGLKASDRCVDYGCGSLRIGMHLMTALEPGNYWGLDVTDRFFEEGLTLLEGELIADKNPRLDVISEPVLTSVKQWQPDLVVSVSVLMHVPPAEIREFLSKIVNLLAVDARAIIMFDRSGRNRRTGPMAWTYSESFLRDQLRQVDGRLDIAFRTFEPVGQLAGEEVIRMALCLTRR